MWGRSVLVTVTSIAGTAGAAKRSNFSGHFNVPMEKIHAMKNSLSGSCVEAS